MYDDVMFPAFCHLSKDTIILQFYYVRPAISVLHDLPKIASIYILNGRALLPKKRLDPAKCKKYDHSIKLKSHKNLFRHCTLTPCLVQIAQCYFDFYKVNQLPWRNYLNFSEKSFLIKLLTLKLKFSLLKIISSINYRLW